MKIITVSESMNRLRTVWLSFCLLCIVANIIVGVLPNNISCSLIGNDLYLDLWPFNRLYKTELALADYKIDETCLFYAHLSTTSAVFIVFDVLLVALVIFGGHVSDEGFSPNAHWGMIGVAIAASAFFLFGLSDHHTRLGPSIHKSMHTNLAIIIVAIMIWNLHFGMTLEVIAAKLDRSGA